MVKVVLQDISGACSVLERLLQPCFGPDGLAVLVNFSGQYCSVQSGYHLVSSISYTKPSLVNHLLVQAVKQFHKSTGDGSKKFILMLAAALRKLTAEDALCCARLSLVQSLAEVSTLLIETIVPSLAMAESHLSHSLKSNVTGEPLENMCLNLMETYIANKVPLSVKAKMVEIAASLCFKESLSVDVLQNRIHHVLENFDEIFTLIPNAPATESKAFPGFIIERDFLVTPPLPLEDFGVVLLSTGLEFDDDDEEDAKVRPTYCVDSTPHLSTILHKIAGFSEQLIAHLAKQGVRLVLSAKKIDPVSIHHLRAHSIGAIQMLSEEQLRYMAQACGSTLCTARDLLMLENAPIHGFRCAHITIGNTRCRAVHLQYSGSDDGGRDGGECDRQGAAAVMLASPTNPQCRQLAWLLRGLLHCLAGWCHHGKADEGGKRLMALRSGGAWELEAARKLARHRLHQGMVKGSCEWVASEALEEALLSIPVALLRNAGTWTWSASRGDRLKMLLRCEDLVDSGSPSLSWEPYCSQVSLVSSVCHFLERVLCIERVMKASRPIASLRHKDDTDDDDDD